MLRDFYLTRAHRVESGSGLQARTEEGGPDPSPGEQMSVGGRARRVQEFLDPDPTRTRSNKFFWTRTRTDPII
jgi:hypothetical protein